MCNEKSAELPVMPGQVTVYSSRACRYVIAIMRYQESSCRGFTLIELLVALTLMALLSILLFGGLRFGMRAWEAGGDRMEQANRIEAVQNLLRRTVSQARLPPRAADEGSFPTFDGSSDQLTFIAPLPAHRGIGGSYLFRLSTQERGDQSDLFLAWQVYRPDGNVDSSLPPEEATTLLPDITAIELSYFGAAGPEQPVRWWDTWTSDNGRPQLVRIRAEFAPGDTRRWPDLIIRIAGPSG